MLSAVGTSYSVNTPLVVTLATLLVSRSVIQMLLSGPTAMPSGPLAAAGIGYSVNTPLVVTLATLPPRDWVNHMFPSQVRPRSGPGGCSRWGRSTRITTPAGVTVPTLLALDWVNQMFPSGPLAMPRGPLFAVSTGYSVIVGRRTGDPGRQPEDAHAQQPADHAEAHPT